MIKIKKIMAAVLSIALVGAFTSCGGDKGTSSESKSGNASVSDSENKGGEKEENSGEDVTIKISWWGGDTRHEATQNAINAFMEENENIKLTYKSVSMAEGLKMMAESSNFTLLDVRRSDEFASGHIPGAVLFTNELMTKADAENLLPNKNQRIFVYCRSGRRSKEASQKLVDYGYSNVIEIGGILDYKGEIER